MKAITLYARSSHSSSASDIGGTATSRAACTAVTCTGRYSDSGC